jgi:hypothetical protein
MHLARNNFDMIEIKSLPPQKKNPKQSTHSGSESVVASTRFFWLGGGVSGGWMPPSRAFSRLHLVVVLVARNSRLSATRFLRRYTLWVSRRVLANNKYRIAQRETLIRKVRDRSIKRSMPDRDARRGSDHPPQVRIG